MFKMPTFFSFSETIGKKKRDFLCWQVYGHKKEYRAIVGLAIYSRDRLQLNRYNQLNSGNIVVFDRCVVFTESMTQKNILKKVYMDQHRCFG